MSLSNFHIDGNVTDAQLLKRSDGFLKNLVASFRQIAANGNFTFGPIKLQDADLNRVHAIVTEIDARRLFWACGEGRDAKEETRLNYQPTQFTDRDLGVGIQTGRLDSSS
jgi:hypothetical protein